MNFRNMNCRKTTSFVYYRQQGRDESILPETTIDMESDLTKLEKKSAQKKEKLHPV